MCADPPDRPACAVGDEKLHVGMTEERVLFRVDELELFRTQLRHRVWHLRGKAAAQVDEGLAAALAGSRLDHYIAARRRGAGAAGGCIRHSHVPYLLVQSGPCVARVRRTQASRSL